MTALLSRRTLLQFGSTAVAGSIAGCTAFQQTGSVDLSVVNLTDERQAVTVTIDREQGDQIWKQQVDLPAREPNDGYKVETTNALREVSTDRSFTIHVSVEGTTTTARSRLTLTCADQDTKTDAVVVRILQDAAGSTTPDITVRSCG